MKNYCALRSEIRLFLMYVFVVILKICCPEMLRVFFNVCLTSNLTVNQWIYNIHGLIITIKHNLNQYLISLLLILNDGKVNNHYINLTILILFNNNAMPAIMEYKI
jgi:hypothetical protein